MGGLGKSLVQSGLPVLQKPSVGPELEPEQAFPAGTPAAAGQAPSRPEAQSRPGHSFLQGQALGWRGWWPDQAYVGAAAPGVPIPGTGIYVPAGLWWGSHRELDQHHG